MATYKKRGYKPKSKSEEIEALEKASTTAGVFNTLDQEWKWDDEIFDSVGLDI